MKIKANAKINLTLDVIGKREDGYHIIDSVFQSISLCDEITVIKDNTITVSCDKGEINDESNIAFIAAQRFFEYTGIKGGAKIDIIKNIPLASGMGGGSADAAAVIVALDKLYETNLGTDVLCKIGLSVGADVPFCIVGGTARVGGIGEQLQKLPDMPNCNMLIIKHGKKLSTADMYKKIDSMPSGIYTTDKVVNGINSGSLTDICDNVSNAFSAVCNNSKLIDDIKTTKPLAVSLSGSGPTVFAIYTDYKATADAACQLKLMQYISIEAKPQNTGLIIE